MHTYKCDDYIKFILIMTKGIKSKLMHHFINFFGKIVTKGRGGPVSTLYKH